MYQRGYHNYYGIKRRISFKIAPLCKNTRRMCMNYVAVCTKVFHIRSIYPKVTQQLYNGPFCCVVLNCLHNFVTLRLEMLVNERQLRPHA